MATTQDVLKLKGRIWESDLMDWRGYRMTALLDWKNRLREVDRVARGAWLETASDNSNSVEYPAVQNLVQSGLTDKAKLCSESVPTIVCYPEEETTIEEQKSHIREAAFDTHWEMNHGDLLVPDLCMDLDGAGGVFVAVYVDPSESDYPIYHRIDPRFCYPDILNGKLLDLITVEDINYRVAAQAFPQLGLDKDPTIQNKFVELLHYWSKDRCIQALLIKPSTESQPTSIQIIKEWDPKGVLPVAFAKLNAFDGHFRGNYDQVIGSLRAKDRIVKQVLDYTDELVYAPREELGVLNPDAPFGPDTTYRLDPMVPNARMGRVAPATGAMQAIQLAQFLTTEERGGINYPSTRQGEVAQSQASSSFVASTMGGLTSDVRNLQRLIGKVREQLNVISAHLEEKFLDFDKPLIRPISKKTTYTPTKAFNGNYKSRCIYGASAGLDRMSADTRVMQHVTNQLVSRETGREQIDYVRDPIAEKNKIDLEQSIEIFKQKMLTEVDTQTMIKLIALQSQGLSIEDAAQQMYTEMQQQQQAQQAQQGQPGQPGPEAAPTSAAQDQQAMQAGAAQPGPNAAPQFAPPPREDVLVGSQRPGGIQKI